jgi:hypothetical protein
MSKPKSNTQQIHREPICKKSRQGNGRGSKPSHRRKMKKGQG